MNVADTPVRLGPRSTSLPGGMVAGSWAIGGQVGIYFT